MRVFVEAFIFACLMSWLFTGKVFGRWDSSDDYERDNGDSWVLGTPDNIPETEFIYIGAEKDCGCP